MLELNPEYIGTVQIWETKDEQTRPEADEREVDIEDPTLETVSEG